jgi:hypothetical protein
VKAGVLIMAVAVLLVPASAAAIFIGPYQGQIKGDALSEIGFDTERTDSGRKRVVQFFTDGISFTCTVGADGRTEPMLVDATFRLNRDREFKGKGDMITEVDPVGKVVGRLKRGGRAVGTVRITGELAGAGSQCTTGVQEWRAAKTS